MGDRANVYVQQGKEPGVYLYTHWTGSELPYTLAAALGRSRDRWDDGQYLARVIFCEMVKGDIDGTTGFGISAVCGDGGDRVLVVNVGAQEVTLNGYEGSKVVSFTEFSAHGDKPWKTW